MKRIWVILAVSTLVLTACGGEAEPTMSAADVQGTAMAVALTMVAGTQAAIPTATPLPPVEAPTATPFPTNTVAPLGETLKAGAPKIAEEIALSGKPVEYLVVQKSGGTG